MKFVKLSIFALTMGLFVASCGNSESEALKSEDIKKKKNPTCEAR